MESSKSPNRALIAIVVVVLLAAAATAAVVLTNKPATDSASTSGQASDMPTSAPQSSDTGSTATSGTFKDGTYSATGSYQTPGGLESIGVKVTLSGGVVTDAQVTKQGQTGEAQEYQAEFVANFKPLVVGKKITDVSLNRVAGSSLTSAGFNDAINDIEKQAQA